VIDFFGKQVVVIDFHLNNWPEESYSIQPFLRTISSTICLRST